MFNFTSKIKGYLIKGVLAVVCAGAVWQNIQIITAKNDRIATQEQTISKLTQDKEDLKNDIVNRSKSEVVTEQAKEDLKQVEVKQEKAKTQANQYVDKKLADIESKYAVLEQNTTNAERKRVEISLERAKGLWLTYCLQEPREHACK